MGLLAFLMNQRYLGDTTVFIINILLFFIIAFTSVLLHELGHAITGRHFSKTQPEIVLESFGGFARFQYARFTKWQHILMVAAGPTMNFVLAGIFYLALLFLIPIIVTPEKGIFIAQFTMIGVWINIIWGLFNLIPVYPLDGGQIMHSFIKKPYLAHQISFVMAIVMAGLALYYTGSIIAPFLFGHMAMQNYQLMSAYKPR